MLGIDLKESHTCGHKDIYTGVVLNSIVCNRGKLENNGNVHQ